MPWIARGRSSPVQRISLTVQGMSCPGRLMMVIAASMICSSSTPERRESEHQGRKLEHEVLWRGALSALSLCTQCRGFRTLARRSGTWCSSPSALWPEAGALRAQGFST